MLCKVMDALTVLEPGDWVLLIMMLAALGSVAGFMAGLLGVGGGIILVPGLFYAFTFLGFESDYLMHVAVGTSLAIIVPTGFSSARAHWKRGAVDVDLVKQIGIGIVIGVVLGTVLADILPGEKLKIIFATALLFFAAMLLIDPKRFTIWQHVPTQPWPGFAGSVIGTVSTLIGIGGATLSVPFMSMCKVPIHRAIGTASALGLVISVPAAIGFALIGIVEEGRPPFSIGFVNILAWGMVIPMSVMVAPLGAWSAHKLPVDTLRKGFAVFMVVVSVRMWVGILS